MDRVASYSDIIKRILDEYAAFFPKQEGVDVEKIYSDELGHYQVMYIGWEGKRRVHGMVLHLDIIGDKVWIQHDGTEDGVADELVEAGIPKDKIVLAFHAPYKRQYTGFAVA